MSTPDPSSLPTGVDGTPASESRGHSPKTLSGTEPPSPEELRAWASSLVDAREAERMRIAREMHDELGQLLSALKIELVGLAQEASGPGPQQRITAMRSLIDETLIAVRRISNDLRPLVLDDLGLHAAMESLARTAAQRMGIEVTVRQDEMDLLIQPAMATALYRMVQEALTNVARHAHATDVCIDLRIQDRQVVLAVEDNGIGLPSDALHRQGSWGLRGLRERVTQFGGHLALDNAPGSGARLRVQLPVDAGGCVR